LGNFEIGRILHFKSEIPKFLIGPGRALFRAMGANPQKAEELQQRLVNFGARATRVARMLPRTQEGRYIAEQLMRSGLASAPNYAEARAAESRRDFVHKLRIVLKELNETRTWLEQIVANGLFSRDKMAAIIAENQELCWIIAASIKTARGADGPI
jgi:four helix bundle protein